MTPEEIESEIEERVKFKMRELITGMRNTAITNWHVAFQTNSQKHGHYLEALAMLAAMAEKEIEMATPSKTMAADKFWEARDKAVREFEERFLKRGAHSPAEFHSHVQFIVGRVEKLLRYR